MFGSHVRSKAFQESTLHSQSVIFYLEGKGGQKPKITRDFFLQGGVIPRFFSMSLSVARQNFMMTLPAALPAALLQFF